MVVNAQTKRDRAASACRGFSLVEMTIVMLIVGILAAMSVPFYLRIRARAKIREAESQVAILGAAIQRLAWDTGDWPGGVNRGVIQNPELWDLRTSAAGLLSCDPTKFTNWKGPYLRSIPAEDPWGKPYFFDPDYTIDGNVLPVVGSFGPNRVGPNVYDKDNIVVVLQRRF